MPQGVSKPTRVVLVASKASCMRGATLGPAGTFPHVCGRMHRRPSPAPPATLLPPHPCSALQLRCPAGYEYLQPRNARRGCYKTCDAGRTPVDVLSDNLRQRLMVSGGPVERTCWHSSQRFACSAPFVPVTLHCQHRACASSLLPLPPCAVVLRCLSQRHHRWPDCHPVPASCQHSAAAT